MSVWAKCPERSLRAKPFNQKGCKNYVFIKLVKEQK